MDAEELRTFVLDVLGQLEPEAQSRFKDALLTRAVRGGSGWKPEKPDAEVVNSVEAFASDVQERGSAEPAEVDARFRLGTQAFYAGDHAAARRIFEALFPVVQDGDVDLGYHEIPDEVLTASLHDCSAQYVASVYLSTPLARRADATYMALETADAKNYWRPLHELERVAPSPLPDLDRFLPLWVSYLEKQLIDDPDGDDDSDYWLREAVQRLEGVAGLERIARSTGRASAFRAWCDALLRDGDWPGVQRACDAAAEVVPGGSYLRSWFRDQAARASAELEAPDLLDRLEVAWLGALTLRRLVRWLGVGATEAATLRDRAERAIEKCPTEATRQLGLLRLLTGDFQSAAALLAPDPDSYSTDEVHSGGLIFAAFAGILARGTSARLAPSLYAALRGPNDEDLDLDEEEHTGSAWRSVTRVSIPDLIETALEGEEIPAAVRREMFTAMRGAAEMRAERVLSSLHRREYAAAARQIACCLEISPVVGEREATEAWMDQIRRAAARFAAFQKELRTALAEMQRV
jgi:hypothetical protein